MGSLINLWKFATIHHSPAFVTPFYSNPS